MELQSDCLFLWPTLQSQKNNACIPHILFVLLTIAIDMKRSYQPCSDCLTEHTLPMVLSLPFDRSKKASFQLALAATIMDPSPFQNFLSTFYSIHGDSTPECKTSISADTIEVEHIEYLDPSDAVRLVSSLQNPSSLAFIVSSRDSGGNLGIRLSVALPRETHAMRSIPLPSTPSGFNVSVAATSAENPDTKTTEITLLRTINARADSEFASKFFNGYPEHTDHFGWASAKAGFLALVAAGMDPSCIHLHAGSSGKALGLPRDRVLWYGLPGPLPLGCLVPSATFPGFLAVGAERFRAANGGAKTRHGESSLYVAHLEVQTSSDTTFGQEKEGTQSKKRKL